MKYFNRTLSIALLAAAPLCLSAAEVEQWETWPDTWVAVDGLGREVASSDGGVTRAEKDPDTSVGMFYYVWHGSEITSGKDISVLLQENPDNPAWGPELYMHWGSRPWLGYYDAGNQYVVQKHVQMLVDAGVDFIFFDFTNAKSYYTQVETVVNELRRREALGMRSLKFAFMVHSDAGAHIKRLYRHYYNNKPEYEPFWYMYDGKPLALCDVSQVTDDNVKNAFTFRNSWAWMRGQKEKEWSWLEFYPQQPGFHKDGSNKVIEQISVSVAQHATSKVGKSYHGGKQPAIDRYGNCVETPQGLYFQEQWNRAIEVHPPVVMVTQFNEWIAQRFMTSNQSTPDPGKVRPGGNPSDPGECYFVDVYSPEFSRDLEPSSHPLVRDNYYYQLVSNTRKYRGVTRIPEPTVSMAVDIAGSFDQWDAESLEFRDDKADQLYHSAQPDVESAESLLRPANDIIRAKVTKDTDNLYFFVETLDPISSFEDSDLWMNLLINADCDYSTGWEGYDYVVRKNPADGLLTLFANDGGSYVWTPVAPVSWRMEGCRMHLLVPRVLVGHASGAERDFDFKWTDNVSDRDPDIMQFISEGDVAPNGRFNYRYKGSVLPAVSSLDAVGVSAEASVSVRPFAGGVSLQLVGASASERAEIFDMLGRKVAETEVTSSAPVSVSLPAGFYAIRCAALTSKVHIR